MGECRSVFIVGRCWLKRRVLDLCRSKTGVASSFSSCRICSFVYSGMTSRSVPVCFMQASDPVESMLDCRLLVRFSGGSVAAVILASEPEAAEFLQISRGRQSHAKESLAQRPQTGFCSSHFRLTFRHHQHPERDRRFDMSTKATLRA